MAPGHSGRFKGREQRPHLSTGQVSTSLAVWGQHSPPEAGARLLSLGPRLSPVPVAGELIPSRPAHPTAPVSVKDSMKQLLNQLCEGNKQDELFPASECFKERLLYQSSSGFLFWLQELPPSVPLILPFSAPCQGCRFQTQKELVLSA